MNPAKLSLRQTLLRYKYQLSLLELKLEQANEDYHAAKTDHVEILTLFEVQKIEVDIRKKKYEISHVEGLLEQCPK